jgi:glycosyltransferase involved in cell wall biosynthesis
MVAAGIYLSQPRKRIAMEINQETCDILIISDDVVGEKMAGPGIRAWELAKSLARYFQVTLAIPDYSPCHTDSDMFQGLAFRIIAYSLKDPGALMERGRQARILLTQGYILSKFPDLKDLTAHQIVDIYVPFVLENLFVHKWKIPELKDRETIHFNDLWVFNDQIRCGDHFLCANERQKDLFIGSLMSLNRINPASLDLNPDIDDLITVVPFGISEDPRPEAPPERNPLRDAFPQIKAEDTVYLWGGVLTNWFDPLTLIQALAKAVTKNTQIKLVFLSTSHPNPLLPQFDMAAQARSLSDKLGLTDTFVFFNPDWVPYKLRSSYFQAADAGVSTHTIHIETRYSFRTRFLDYFKHELPVICTEGDAFAELVARENIGRVVPQADPETLAQALLELAENPGLKQQMALRIKTLKPLFAWNNVTEPLSDYCRDVLAGKIAKKPVPRDKDVALLFRAKRDSWLKKTGKRYLGRYAQRIPFKLAARMKRRLHS